MAGNAKKSKTQITLYILGHKIQKKRYECLVNAAKRKGFDIVTNFSCLVSHVVSELETCDKVIKALKVNDADDWCEDVELLSMTWFTQCMREGRTIPVLPEHRLPWNKKEEVDNSDERSLSTMQYACQRSTPLQHHNCKFTQALEILEQNAQFHETDEQYSRALAFRRGSAVLKSMNKTLTSLSQVRGLKNIGRHCFKVIKEVLEDGYSEEVEEIEQSSWFQTMKLFTSVFGVGPSTANKWISQGLSSIHDAIHNSDVYRKDDPRISVGLAFHDDLTLEVTKMEAEQVEILVKREAEAILPGVRVELVGGFKRGKDTGHDVDLLLSHPDEGDEVGLLPALLKRLDRRGLILFGRQEKSTFSDEVLHSDTKLTYLRGGLDHFEKWIGILKVDKTFRSKKTAETESNPQSYKECNAESTNQEEGKLRKRNFDSFEESGPPLVKQSSLDSYCRVSQGERDWYARRVDLIVVPASQYYYALVGWIGSKHFNRSLRLYAQRELNLKLTAHGLYDYSQKKPLPACSEEEIFSHLKISYRKPEERNC